ncbi:2,5-dichloro-2,5-cyclohexadiene-1,4-diol dehydrogenase [compost metagenome]
MKNLFDLSGKTVLLFGGSGILGKEFTKALTDHQAHVVSCDIYDLSPELKLEGVDYQVVDAGNETELIEFRERIIERYKKVDVIINAVTAKHNDFYLPFDEVSLEGWEIGLRGNLTVPFIVCKTFIRQLCEQGFGSIINISSVYGLVGNDQSIYEGSNLHEIYVKDSPEITQIYSHGVYNAAKGGLNNFTRYLAAYYGKYNIRVNTISPGGIEYPQENETFLKKYGAKTPLGRKAKKDEINGAVVFLASDASSYVTGHNLVVDGGFTAW